MSKPRWRWATRDNFGDLSLKTFGRHLWSRRPAKQDHVRRCASDKARSYWTYPPDAYPPTCRPIDVVDVCASDFRRRFGRDLRPGEIRRLK